MAFDPKTLPPGVYDAFKQGAIAWPLVLKKALDAMIFDLTKLTDIIFYLHYPERIGNPLKPYETSLINKWKGFRLMITPQVNSARAAHYRIFNGIEGTDVGGGF